ncbi:MAG: amino acid permease, partial [Pseudonocardia sp.]|nr:amino acid permease [Pseudonocardia sp.]
LELFVAQGLLTLLFPAAPTGIWPYVVILPVLALNLLGHQITGKTQAVLVAITLVGDIVLAVGLWWVVADSGIWAANWESPSPITWLTPFIVAGLWIGIMAGILEVQQVVVDEWRNFAVSRDVGLLSAAYGLWIRQIPLALAVLASAPLVALLAMPVPTVGVVQERVAEYQGHPLFYLALLTMLVATYTTLSVFFMAMGRLVALYAQQGALPRVLARYSSRAVPWVAIVALALFALIGVYWTNWAAVVHILGAWAVTLYFVVALFYLRMRSRKDLDRPLTARYGVPVAVVLLVYTALIAFGIFSLDWKAAAAWVAIVVVVVLYDKFVVPRTKRGGFYREQVTRQRTDATRL